LQTPLALLLCRLYFQLGFQLHLHLHEMGTSENDAIDNLVIMILSIVNNEDNMSTLEMKRRFVESVL
jgi:hypothetical protein